MFGITHCLIGFFVGEICWQIIKRQKQTGYYSRGWFWLIGLLGGYTPDFDGLSGISANITFFDDPWEYETLLRYHHDFSHSLGFLLISIVLIILLFVGNKKLKPLLETKESEHPMGKKPMEKTKGSPLVLTSFILSFLFYREWNKFVVFFIMLGLLALLAYMYYREERPWYGIAFFGGILSHLGSDFIANNFQPFGPWDPNYKIGWRLIYDATPESFQLLMKFLLEGPFYLLFAVIIIMSVVQVARYNSRKKKTPNQV